MFLIHPLSTIIVPWFSPSPPSQITSPWRGAVLRQDLNLAKQHFFRCREVDPSGLHAPVTLALTLLACHLWPRRRRWGMGDGGWGMG